MPICRLYHDREGLEERRQLQTALRPRRPAERSRYAVFVPITYFNIAWLKTYTKQIIHLTKYDFKMKPPLLYRSWCVQSRSWCWLCTKRHAGWTDWKDRGSCKYQDWKPVVLSLSLCYSPSYTLMEILLKVQHWLINPPVFQTDKPSWLWIQQHLIVVSVWIQKDGSVLPFKKVNFPLSAPSGTSPLSLSTH